MRRLLVGACVAVGLVALLAPTQDMAVGQRDALVVVSPSEACATTEQQLVAAEAGESSWARGLVRVSSGCLQDLERLGAGWR